jgi:hypothetical protein
MQQLFETLPNRSAAGRSWSLKSHDIISNPQVWSQESIEIKACCEILSFISARYVNCDYEIESKKSF